ncbi:hypothetical protein BDFG_01774 [Blastomyces dermatitidis ATCC 26199]|nr:hypothetical protein BDFG_01774 [Blastomyces dermatitidis ATCC 26199]
MDKDLTSNRQLRKRASTQAMRENAQLNKRTYSSHKHHNAETNIDKDSETETESLLEMALYFRVIPQQHLTVKKE